MNLLFESIMRIIIPYIIFVILEKRYSKKESHQKASRNALHRIKNDRRLRDELTKPSTDNSQQ